MRIMRESVRRIVSVPATIDSGNVQVGGVILDVTPKGARVRLSSGTFLGAHCTLTSSLFGVAVPSRIVWRRGSEIGLRFKAALNLRQDIGRLRASAETPEPRSMFGRRAAG